MVCNVMIKPVSGNCNCRCSYCFYSDVSEHRVIHSYGKMSDATLENIIKKFLETAEYECTFAFQGGEPTLAGLAYYKNYVALVNKFNKKNIKVSSCLQTNGLIIDESWAEFFAENNFLIGLSLDGTRKLHDKNRRTANNAGTFKDVLKAIGLFEKYKVRFNILTVVTAQTAENIEYIYSFYRSRNLLYQQYIPCLDPYGQPRGNLSYSLTPTLYADFLIKLFDIWYEDIINGRFIYINYFEDIVGMLTGHAPQSCTLMGVCSPQYVVEADGSIYPCDFYCMDEYYIGNINSHDIQSIDAMRKKNSFIEKPTEIKLECMSCQYGFLCRGGCRRDRDAGDGSIKSNYYCEAYKAFFTHALPKFKQIAAACR